MSRKHRNKKEKQDKVKKLLRSKNFKVGKEVQSKEKVSIFIGTVKGYKDIFESPTMILFIHDINSRLR